VSFGVPPYKETSNRWPDVEIVSNVASLSKKCLQQKHVFTFTCHTKVGNAF
jgi:hypothetical protein